MPVPGFPDPINATLHRVQYKDFEAGLDGILVHSVQSPSKTTYCSTCEGVEFAIVYRTNQVRSIPEPNLENAGRGSSMLSKVGKSV